MGAFFPLDSHPMAYFTICEMHGFPHEFSALLENVTKPIVWGEPGKLVLIIFPCYGCFFPLDSHSTVYLIIWEMYGFLHQFSIVQENKTQCVSPHFALEGEGVEPATNQIFKKGGGLTDLHFYRGIAGREGGDVFQEGGLQFFNKK